MLDGARRVLDVCSTVLDECSTCARRCSTSARRVLDAPERRNFSMSVTFVCLSILVGLFLHFFSKPLQTCVFFSVPFPSPAQNVCQHLSWQDSALNPHPKRHQGLLGVKAPACASLMLHDSPTCLHCLLRKAKELCTSSAVVFEEGKRPMSWAVELEGGAPTSSTPKQCSCTQKTLLSTHKLPLWLIWDTDTACTCAYNVHDTENWQGHLSCHHCQTQRNGNIRRPWQQGGLKVSTPPQ